MDRALRHFLVWIYLASTLYMIPCVLTVNLALKKPATQVGTWGEHKADKAVDGDRRQKLSDRSCAHPQSSNGPAWWSVDLANNEPLRTFVIKNITIYFRTDCCGGSRIIDNEIWVGDTPGTTTSQALCARTVTMSSTQTLPCNPVLEKGVRYLTIRHITERSLGLCEVIVNGYEYEPCQLGKWGENCLLDCNCEYNCNDITGKCKDCGNGYFGKGCGSRCNCYNQAEICKPRDGSCPQTGCAHAYGGTNCSIAQPEVKQAPRLVSATPTTITVSFSSSIPPGDEYRLEYTKDENFRYQEGERISHSNQASFTLTQRGLQFETKYRFRIMPYLKGQQGVESETLLTYTKSLPAFSNDSMEIFPSSSSATIHFETTTPPAEWYQLEYRISGSSSSYQRGKQVAHTRNGRLSITQESLQPNTKYDFRIIPRIPSENIEGYPSNAVQVSTSELPQTTTTEGPVERPVPAGGGGGGTIAGIVVVILLVVFGVLAFVAVRRYRSGKPMPGGADPSKCMQIFNRNRGEKPPHIEPEPPKEPSSDNEIIPPPPPSTPPPIPEPSTDKAPDDIPTAELAKYIQNKKNTPDAFKDEFKKLPIGSIAKWNVGNKTENKNKNRFLNIRAYDHSRVVLELFDGDIHSDYINADYITGYGGVKKTYIASQGPKKGACVADTWRMVWQTNSNRVVMVTNLVEGGRVKCEPYWPDTDSAIYGDIKVTILSTDNYAAYVIRIFNVEYSGESRTVRQFHFTSWPDHGVPNVGTELLEFRKRVKTFDKQATGPLIIHCSAGVGRTGTYIAVDYCLLQAKQEDVVNIWQTTNKMRQDRVNMIQTLDQYIFVYDAILEALTSGETGILAAKFRAEYDKLCTEDPEPNKTPLDKQFATLETLKTLPSDGKPLVALESDNANKNRFKDIVPSNRYRPFLSTLIEGTTSYINAVYVDGFRAKLAYLVTQMPLPRTVVDFWRLIHDHHSTTIIMLNTLDKNDKDTGVYWPEEKDQTLTFGPLEITMTSVDTEHPHITVREFKLTNSKTRRTPMVRQFQLTSWPKEDQYPEDRASLLQIVDMVEKWQQQTGNGPVTIHCTDGASQCGMFVASMYAIEQLKVDQEVDVYRAVKQVRIPRPQFIQDIGQYKFVHEMMLEYMSGFGDYSNFS